MDPIRAAEQVLQVDRLERQGVRVVSDEFQAFCPGHIHDDERVSVKELVYPIPLGEERDEDERVFAITKGERFLGEVWQESGGYNYRNIGGTYCRVKNQPWFYGVTPGGDRSHNYTTLEGAVEYLRHQVGR